MVKKKGKSKRTTLKDKYKIQKRTVEHHRKLRRQAKRDKAAGKIKHKAKDPGIPSTWPFKEDLLQQIERAKETMRTNKEQKLSKEDEARNLAEMMARNAVKQEEFQNKVSHMLGKSSVSATGAADNDTTTTRANNETKLGQQSRRAYLRELKKVVENADVILQVLDARDPMGSRAGAVEDLILSRSDKRMVLVLNKVDLVPKEAVSGWLNMLRRSHPTLAIKAATMNDGSCSARAKGDNALKGSAAVGVEGLLQLMKNYSRSIGKKKGSITVGVIGYPNVGKSSIINSLKRARAVGVSPRPGFTTSMQEVVLDKNIRLLDSPGIVFDDDDEKGGVDVLLRNCVDTDALSDPVPAIKGLIERCSQESLLMTYCIPAFPPGDENIFLGMIAKKYGKVKKGGIPDKVAAAKHVLRDWNSGKVPFYTPPPAAGTDEMHKAGLEHTAQVVSHFGAEFDVAQMAVHDDAVMESLGGNDEFDFVKLQNTRRSDGPRVVVDDEESDDDDDKMDEDSDEEMGDESNVKVFRNANVAHADDYDFAGL
mmetsp:Transcript_23575/g.36362  ORF Transcript_23575/g.36362 Transcript_23575/m.36362 type:complete len:537 (-) Transcript_23575:14-1624(-)